MVKRKSESFLLLSQITFFCVEILLSAALVAEHFIYGLGVNVTTMVFSLEGSFAILLLINLIWCKKHFAFPGQFGSVGIILLVIFSIVLLSQMIPQYIYRAQQLIQSGFSFQEAHAEAFYLHLSARFIILVLGISTFIIKRNIKLSLAK